MTIKCLIVEDEPLTMRLFKMSLSALPVDIITATNGTDAITQLDLHRPDVVLLDMYLPAVPGTEVIKYIRGSPALKHTKIIIITAIPQSLQAAEARHADTYFTKPVNMQQLAKTIQNYIHGEAYI